MLVMGLEELYRTALLGGLDSKTGLPLLTGKRSRVTEERKDLLALLEQVDG